MTKIALSPVMQTEQLMKTNKYNLMHGIVEDEESLTALILFKI